jgi:intracellular multiplication protein IcmE
MTDDNNNAGHHEAHEELPRGGFGEGDFDDFEGGSSGNTLGDLWRNNPGVKIAVVVGVLVLLIGGIVLFGGHTQHALNSRVVGASTIKEAPGGDNVSKSYADAVAEKNQQTLEEAEKSQGSAIPVPISAPKEPTPLPQDQTTAEDPLARWRRIQEERTKHDTTKKPDVPQQDPNGPAIKSLADAIAKQMESILKSMKPVAPQYKSIMTDDQWKEKQDKDQKDTQTAAQTTQAAANATQTVNILEPAGSIEYGQLITQANTDAPGPVLIELASGPLSGSRMLGTFKQLGQADLLVLSFDTIVIKGVSYSASAVALDPSTANPGLVSEVDNRYLERVVLPAAAAFVQGLGNAVADSGNTNVSVNGDTVVSSTTKLNTKQQVYAGLAAGTSKFGEIIDQQAGQIKPLITVDAGTPIAVLFTDPVTDSAKAK